MCVCVFFNRYCKIIAILLEYFNFPVPAIITLVFTISAFIQIMLYYEYNVSLGVYGFNICLIYVLGLLLIYGILLMV